MLKTVLLAIFAIGISSCHQVDDANKLYSSLLPDGDPMFDIRNEKVPIKVRAYREGTDVLAFYVVRRKVEGEIVFRFNNRIHLLYAIKIRFDAEAGVLDLVFQPQDTSGSPTNIMITTTVSDKVDLQGDHGITADPITVDMIQFLLGSKNPRGKSTVLGGEWVVEYIRKKKPMFLDIQRGPATLVFVGGPLIINGEVYAKMRELKDRITATKGGMFLSWFGN